MRFWIQPPAGTSLATPTHFLSSLNWSCCNRSLFSTYFSSTNNHPCNVLSPSLFSFSLFPFLSLLFAPTLYPTFCFLFLRFKKVKCEGTFHCQNKLNDVLSLNNWCWMKQCWLCCLTHRLIYFKCLFILMKTPNSVSQKIRILWKGSILKTPGATL